MRTALLLLIASISWAAPSATPEEAVVRTLGRMRGSLHYSPEAPAPRGPHEWDARRVLAAGTVNGCVESAKAFFSMFHEDYPSLKTAYLDSFNSAGEGGHAVVQVTGSDGRDFIVDAASFETLPAPVRLSEADLAAPIDIRKERRGRILQPEGKGDVLLEKAGGIYKLTVYRRGEVFDGVPLLAKSFRTLAELNRAASEYSFVPLDFTYLRNHGLILPFADATEESFVYVNPAGGLARYVVYGRHARLPEPDDAESREPAARARFAAKAAP